MVATKDQIRICFIFDARAPELLDDDRTGVDYYRRSSRIASELIVRLRF